MGIYSAHSADAFANVKSEPRTKQYWDPTTTLNIINPDRGYLTCVGFAPSCGRRCRNPINQGNRTQAFQLLEDLSYIDVSKVDIKAKLHQLARHTLCLRYHQDQVYDMVEEWSGRVKRLHSLADDATNVKPDPYVKSGTEKLDKRLEDLEDLVQRLLKKLAAQEEQTRKQEEARARNTREERKRAEQQYQQNERERTEREEREKQQRKRQERENAEREEKERKKRQEEQREQARQAREKEAREREERNERVRQRAEQMRKDRERAAKEQAEKAKEQWNSMWLDYVRRWDDIKKNARRGNSEQLQKIIPWPVKSGNCTDVTESAVEEFFRNAVPDAHMPDKMFAFMKMECLKWHPDKVPKMFGSLTDKTLEELFRTVARVVIKMRADAASNRGR